jgi:4-hydroxybenzoate polyprenyltransferase
MIFAFFGAHYAVSLNFQKQDKALNLENLLYLTPLFAAIFLFFLKLRLFDEVKDIESDAINHPERPLPRGILRKEDILRATLIIMIMEIALFSLYGLSALASSVIAVIYSLVMYKEFFLKKWLRSHLTIYAVTHTFVVVFISIAIFSSLLNKPITRIPTDLIYFSFAGWFLFNIFEFGRKTFSWQEEKKGIASYSKNFGKYGAVLLVLAMAALSILFIDRATTFIGNSFLLLWLGLTGIAGLLYIIVDRPPLARVYRFITSLYIILTYGTVTILQLYSIQW